MGGPAGAIGKAIHMKGIPRLGKINATTPVTKYNPARTDTVIKIIFMGLSPDPLTSLVSMRLAIG
jgi:hypothetical protein